MKKLILLLMVVILSVPLSAQHWAEENAWYFDNFVEPNDLPWELFRETFIGIAPTKASSGNFDVLFYDLMYKSELAGPGHCYGMILMAALIYKNGGHLGYCHPPRLYPSADGSPDPVDTVAGPADPNLRRAIEIVHGMQINHTFLLHMLDIIAKNKNRDGNYAYAQADYFLAQGDVCLLSITKSLSPADGGHALLVYQAQDLGGTKRLYVYDPNRSYFEAGASGQLYYDGFQNFISINSGSGEWSFTMADGELWQGNPASGGNIVVTPLSIAGRRDRLPQSIFADAADIVNKVFVLGAGTELEQVSDETGRRLLQPGTTEWETDPNLALRSVYPLIPYSQGRPYRGPQVYFSRGESDLNIAVKGKGQGCELAVIGPRHYVKVNAPRGEGRMEFRFQGLVPATPQVAVISRGSFAPAQAELQSIVYPGQANRKVHLENLSLSQEDQLQFGFGQNGIQVIAQPAGQQPPVKVSSSLVGMQMAEVQEISLPPGEKMFLPYPELKKEQGKKPVRTDPPGRNKEK